MTNVPQSLQVGDEVRVVAPACSLASINPEPDLIAQRFDELGLRLSFGRHIESCDDFGSSPVADRIADLHEAFADPSVKAILTVVGGYNSNQLLPHLDWELIKANPKILCGYSDITALTCSIWAKTAMTTYSGPHYSTFGMRKHFDQTLSWFTQMLMTDDTIVVEPAQTWTDDAWFLDQENRRIEPNDGYWVLSEGTAAGHLVGGNLCTFNLLQGTEYMPDLHGAIVFVEDDLESTPSTFDRDLASLTQQPGFGGVVGLLIGRFQGGFEMTRGKLQKIVETNSLLDGLPILANMDFGHTNPLLTLPVGGQARFDAIPGSPRFEICR